jgi:hypothetical protein
VSKVWCASRNWQEYRPKHGAENIVNKIHQIILKCILLVTYTFLDLINGRKMEHV